VKERKRGFLVGNLVNEEIDKGRRLDEIFYPGSECGYPRRIFDSFLQRV